MRTRGAVFFLVAMLPIGAFAAYSVVVKPQNDTVVLPIADASQSQEFFGRLTDFPHTFGFTVQKEFDFVGSVSVPDQKGQKEDITSILVKEEKRGVSEVGRTSPKAQAFERSYNPVYATYFKSGGSITAHLQPGTYRFEVSSPNNDALYRLVIGDSGIHRSYFSNIEALLSVNALYGYSPLHVFLSTLIYIPVLVLVALVLLFFLYRKRYTIGGSHG